MTVFRVWAPVARQVEVETGGARQAMTGGDEQVTTPAGGQQITPGDSQATTAARRQPMIRRDGGWWEFTVADVGPGDDYAFVLDGGEPLPDPRSPWQPHGVHGPSRVVDHSAYEWHDAGWHGVPLPGSVVYELHVGTFTPEGTFDGVISKLDHLIDIGVDLIELLPVNAFPGRHGWGYDGVDLYAVHDPYGGPEGLKRLVDACHGRGLGVILDVVYNHLGPSGNYLSRFGPYFTDAHHTPWGPAVNYDDAGSDEVRRFIIDNALMWLTDYHLDGLRLDAVHAIVDTSAKHILEQLAEEVDALAAQLGRPLSLIAESDLNDPRVVRAREAHGYGMTAQWSDDFHHAVHALLTGERDGYYADFGSYDDVAAALTQGYVFVGQHSDYRDRAHGRPFVGLPGHRLLGYLQDHDQVGNRAQGERTSELLTRGRLEIGAALVLTSPFTPMLWMGEEWAASTPWQYFTDHQDPDLAEAVRTGRRSEFQAFGWDPEQVPDPQDPATFERSRLDWGEVDKDDHACLLDWHRKLIQLRRVRPELIDGDLVGVEVSYDDDDAWIVVRRGGVVLVINLSDEEQRVPVPAPVRTVLLASREGFAFDPGGVTLAGESAVVAALAEGAEV